MTFTTVEESRAGELDQWLQQQTLVDSTPGELFAVVDAIDSQSALKRAFTDPAATAEAKQGLAVRLFEGKVGAQALEVITRAASMRWRSGAAFVDALERQAVRGEFQLALASSGIDAVIDELIGFAEVVRSSPDLRAALNDHSRPAKGRQQLVDDLLAGRATGWTGSLARRAALGRVRNFEVTLDGYLELAAVVRQRKVAKVTLARPMAPDQVERLRAALVRMTGADVDLQFHIDPSVIGGVSVAIGDQVIQGTVADRLEQVKRSLV